MTPVLHWACDARGGQGGGDRKKQRGTHGGGDRKKQGGTQGGGDRKKQGGTPTEHLESEFLSQHSHGFARWPSWPSTSVSPLVTGMEMSPF